MNDYPTLLPYICGWGWGWIVFCRAILGRFSVFTLSSLKTKTDTFESSVDSNEMTHNEPFHLDLYRLQFSF